MFVSLHVFVQVAALQCLYSCFCFDLSLLASLGFTLRCLEESGLFELGPLPRLFVAEDLYDRYMKAYKRWTLLVEDTLAAACVLHVSILCLALLA